MLQFTLPVVLLNLLFASIAFATTVRYTDMDENELKDFLNGKTDQIVEFRKGDIIQLKFKVRGEVLESISSPSSEIQVSKGFFLKSDGSEIMLSWDHSKYLPIKEQIQGSLQASASGSDTISALLFELEANRRL